MGHNDVPDDPLEGKLGAFKTLIPRISGEFKSRRQVVKFSAQELKAVLRLRSEVNEHLSSKGLSKLSVSQLVRGIVRYFIVNYKDPFWLTNLTPEDLFPDETAVKSRNDRGK